MTIWTTPALADCDPGIEPVDINVLVTMAEMPEKTPGGLVLPDAVRDREQFGSDHARVVAVSQHAFTYAKDWTDPKPKPGDVVFVGKHPGQELIGKDGRKYRLVSDREIAAVIERTPQAESTNG